MEVTDIQSRVNKVIQGEMAFYYEQVNKLISDYAKKNNLMEEDLKKHGQRKVFIHSGEEHFMYKNDVICIVKNKVPSCSRSGRKKDDE